MTIPPATVTPPTGATDQTNTLTPVQRDERIKREGGLPVPTSCRTAMIELAVAAVFVILVGALVTQLATRITRRVHSGQLDDNILKLDKLNAQLESLNSQINNPLTPHDQLVDLINQRNHLKPELTDLNEMINNLQTDIKNCKLAAKYTLFTIPGLAVAICGVCPFVIKFTRTKDFNDYKRENPTNPNLITWEEQRKTDSYFKKFIRFFTVY